MSIERTPERVYKHILRYGGLPSVSTSSNRALKDRYTWKERLDNLGYNTSLLQSADYESIYKSLNLHKFDNIKAYDDACVRGDREMVRLLSEYVTLPDEERCVQDTDSPEVIEGIFLPPTSANTVLLSSLSKPEKIRTLLKKYSPDTVLHQALLTPNITNDIEESIVLMISFASEEVIDPLAHLASTHLIAKAFEDRGHIYSREDALRFGLSKSFQAWLDTQPSIRRVQEVLERLIVSPEFQRSSNSYELVEDIVSRATFDLVPYFVTAARYRRADICNLFTRYDVDSTEALTLAIKQRDANTVNALRHTAKPQHKKLANSLRFPEIFNLLR